MGRTLGNDSVTGLADHDVRGGDNVFVLEAVWQTVWRRQYGQAARRQAIARDFQAKAAKRCEGQKSSAVDSQCPSCVCRIARRSARHQWYVFNHSHRLEPAVNRQTQGQRSMVIGTRGRADYTGGSGLEFGIVGIDPIPSEVSYRYRWN